MFWRGTRIRHGDARTVGISSGDHPPDVRECSQRAAMGVRHGAFARTPRPEFFGANPLRTIAPESLRMVVWELLGGGRALGVGGLAAADSGAPTTAARRAAALRGG